MSTDTVFSPLTYPSLGITEQDRRTAQARARGHAAGYAEGLRAAAADIQRLRDRLAAEHAAELRHGHEQVARAIGTLATAAEALDARTAPVLAEAENSLFVAAIELAEAILGRELADVKTGARAALDRAIAHVEPSGVRAVRMNPDDLACLDPDTRSAVGVDFVADPSIRRGDAITELPDGYLDARIGTALARARAALLDAGEA